MSEIADLNACHRLTGTAKNSLKPMMAWREGAKKRRVHVVHEHLSGFATQQARLERIFRCALTISKEHHL